MTDCIRSLFINCSHLKELFILSNITFHYQSYLKIFFQFIYIFNLYFFQFIYIYFQFMCFFQFICFFSIYIFFNLCIYIYTALQCVDRVVYDKLLTAMWLPENCVKKDAKFVRIISLLLQQKNSRELIISAPAHGHTSVDLLAYNWSLYIY